MLTWRPVASLKTSRINIFPRKRRLRLSSSVDLNNLFGDSFSCSGFSCHALLYDIDMRRLRQAQEGENHGQKKICKKKGLNRGSNFSNLLETKCWFKIASSKEKQRPKDFPINTLNKNRIV